jgi:phosphopantetheine--protein transferase-like protein|tara:strand:+ start:96 stop:410 length:315 start_codon:yes stop_codon:yes gene_type:complete
MNIGVDIVSINRIRTVFEKYGTRFTDQFLTESEKGNKLTAEYLAKCWAVKEASIKASGVVDAKQFAYGKNGKQPIVVTDVTGTWNLSVSDEKDYTIATVIKSNE